MSRWKKLGLIAASGSLPVRIAEMFPSGVFVVRLEGLADPALASCDGEDCGMGEAGKIIRSLKNAGCDAVVFAGHLRRPDFSSLKVDWRGAALLPRVIAAAARGDGAILSVLVDAFESEGMTVIGAEETMESLAAPAGVIAGAAPDESQRADIAKAAAIVNALGPYDVGQGAVVSIGHVIAIEAAEGTDAMLDRCAQLPSAKGGVLVKRPKPGQELRVDLPVIGSETVRRAAAAGLAGIAVEAGLALVIDSEEMIAAAESAGLFVYGFSAAELAAQ
ncbi:MAG: UDP-2,3-diacylglucosamine diphosphatase LpxI [Parvularculaceae bacterium]